MRERRTPSRTCETCKRPDVVAYIKKWDAVGTISQAQLHKILVEHFGYAPLTLPALSNHIRRCVRGR